MLKFLKTAIGATAAMAIGATASAGISEGEIRQLMASKGLQYAGEERAPDGSIKVVAGVDMVGNPFAFTMLDMELDGVYDVVLFMSAVQTTAKPPLNVLNAFNENTMSKAVYTQNQAMLMVPMVTMGSVDQTNLSATFDVLRVELGAYNAALSAYRPGSASGNTLGVSLSGNPKALDAGMTKVQISTRDNAFTDALNKRGLSHLAESGADDSRIDALKGAAFDAGKAFFE